MQLFPISFQIFRRKPYEYSTLKPISNGHALFMHANKRSKFNLWILRWHFICTPECVLTKRRTFINMYVLCARLEFQMRFSVSGRRPYSLRFNVIEEGKRKRAALCALQNPQKANTYFICGISLNHVCR